MATQKELDACLVDRKKFWEERDALLNLIPATDVDNAKAVIGGIRGTVTDLTNKLGIAQAEVKNKEEIISRLQVTLLQKDDEIKTLDDKLDLSNNTVAQLGKDKGNLAIEAAQLKLQVDTLKQAATNQSVTLTWGDIFQMLLKQKITISKG